MRILVVPAGILLASIMMLLPAVAEQLPACNRQVLTRHGNSINVSMSGLTRKFNQQLEQAHSHFSNLQLSPEGNNELQVSGEKDGTPMSISGPLKVTSDGEVELQAKHIKKNGSGVKGVMDLFGQNLSDHLNLKSTRSLRVDGDNLVINQDTLLGVRGDVTDVQVHNSGIKLHFAAPPCR